MATALSLTTEELGISAGVDVVHLDGTSLDKELRNFKKNVWKTKEFSDFTLKTREGGVFRVHKAYTAPHMTYFQKYSTELSQDCALVDIESDVLEMVLEYLYEGQLEVTRGNIAKLNAAAEYLGVDTLQKQCQYEVLSETEMTLDNCLDIWNYAVDVGDETLSKQALCIVLENFDTIQQQPAYTKLSPAKIMQLLSDNDLKVHSPDEMLGAAMNWTMYDPESNLQHLPAILDLLPLQNMQKWYLKQVMLSPGVKASDAACSKLRAALDMESQANPDRKPREQVIPNPTVQSSHLLAVGVQQISCGILQSADDTMWSVELQDNLPVKKVGNVKIGHISGGVRMCASKDGNIFIGGLGKDMTEIWKYNMHSKQTDKAGSLNTGRQFHAMCYTNDRIYILGGRRADKTSVTSVEVLDPQEGRITDGGILQDTDMGLCCTAYDDDTIFTVSRQFVKTTVQIFSVSTKKTICVTPIPWKTKNSPLGILAVDRSTFLVFSSDYTAVCTMADIRQSNTYTFKKMDKYILPNNFPAVTLSADRQHILLLGGFPKDLNPQHFVYCAGVQDVLQDTGRGWEKVNSPWPLGACSINTYTTVTFTTDV